MHTRMNKHTRPRRTSAVLLTETHVLCAAKMYWHGLNWWQEKTVDDSGMIKLYIPDGNYTYERGGTNRKFYDANLVQSECKMNVEVGAFTH
jgi:hypothetical protein